ncbi:hypothetical protein BG000_002568 [Podila horticola]|nr:hypothetical protein BG000_002568 [Podila horticola]
MPNQLTDDQIDYLFQEPEWYAEQAQIGIDGTRPADCLVPPGLKERLMGYVKKLMDFPEDKKDWHPDSDKIMYGLEDYKALNQPLDGIMTKEERCIAFPNIYQHRVQPLELQDPTSLKEWAPRTDLWEEVARKLPQELMDEIDKLVDWPIELEEALAHRLELMRARKFLLAKRTKIC